MGEEFVEKATQLIAAHGVFALTAIFIFVMYNRVSGQLSRAAGTRQESYYKTVHGYTVAMTFVLVVAASAIWIYATFFYAQITVTRGDVAGLRQTLRTERPEGSSTRFEDALWLEDDSRDFYSSLELTQSASADRVLRWAYVTKGVLPSLAFNFRQTLFSSRLHAADRLSTIQASNISQLMQETPEHCTAKLTLDRSYLQQAKAEALKLWYEPNPDTKVSRLGHFYARHGGRRTKLEWESVSPPSCAGAIASAPSPASSAPLDPWSLFRGVAHAEMVAPAFNPDDRKALWAALGANDLPRQVKARREILARGPHAHALVAEWIQQLYRGNGSSAALGYTDSPGDAVQNLAVLLDALDAPSSRFSAETYVQIAFVHYLHGLYAPAWHYFSVARKRGFAPWSGTLQFAWAHCCQEIGEYDSAVRSFDQARGTAEIAPSELDAAIAITYSTWAESTLDAAKRAKLEDQKRKYYLRALEEDPNNASANNGLAYDYAERGERLDKALALVDRALSRAPNDAEAMDTKGWVLFKLKRYREALPLIERAVRELPDRREHHDHLAAVKRALATPEAK
jgi:tetratricopeptide (TPR) repeat protein